MKIKTKERIIENINKKFNVICDLIQSNNTEREKNEKKSKLEQKMSKDKRKKSA